MSYGVVYWVTGLAGAGKTTIGSALYTQLLNLGRRVVFLDGDSLREVFGGQFGYGIEDRRYLAMCYARMCKLLADQGSDVVCATVSMFNDVRTWNRDNIAEYHEIYIVAPEEHLHERRAFYTDPQATHHVVGLNPDYELPANPDVTIHNDARTPPEQLAQQLLTKLAAR